MKIRGRRYWLWRAVDQRGIVLDILVQERRNQQAAETFFQQLVEGCGCRPRVLITHKLASYPPAQRRVLPRVDHRRHKGLDSRAENSHPTRRRERVIGSRLLVLDPTTKNYAYVNASDVGPSGAPPG